MTLPVARVNDLRPPQPAAPQFRLSDGASATIARIAVGGFLRLMGLQGEDGEPAALVMPRGARACEGQPAIRPSCHVNARPDSGCHVWHPIAVGRRGTIARRPAIGTGEQVDVDRAAPAAGDDQIAI
jgi:hypothetical protein